jgi:cyclic pyranopterin phosphate synthase
MMLDKVNRKIDYLRISITDRCNLRCVYCMPSAGVPRLPHEAVLRYEEILRIVKVAAAKGIKKVRLTGGEPLVRKGITSLVREIAATPGIEDLSLTTNGILLGRMARELTDAGLKRVNVSLDSLDEDRFRELTRGGELKDVLEGIHKAEEAGFDPIKINVVAIKGFNDEEVREFARLTLLKPYQVRFIEFMPIGHRAMWEDSKVMTEGEIMDRISTLGELTPIEWRGQGGQGGPARLYRLPGAKGILGFISPLSNHFCGSCNRLRLTADGKIRPCLFSETEIDLKTPLRSGCDDAELSRLISIALSVKPEGHSIADGVKEKYRRTMSRIGG